MDFDWRSVSHRATSSPHEIRINCPHCQDTKFHCYVNTQKRVYHCFRCQAAGRLPREGPALSHYRQLVHDFLQGHEGVTATVPVSLPREYVLLTPRPMSLMGRKAYDYLRFRGLTHQEIERYALGYCATGVYAERVIIPIIDERGLQYFVARSFTTREPRYLNPHRDRSDILFWTEVKPQSRLVVVCEGVFDAMRVGRLLPACALLGHELTPDQLSRLEARADYAIILMDPDVFTASLKLWVMVKPHVQAVAIKLKRKDPADYMNADALVHEVVNYLVAQPGVSRTLCEEFRQQIMTHLAGRN